ncbi:GT2 family glycosyltransferase [Rhizobium sp. PP-CC-3A-592]|nr:GT2 family glycosyltransferase [Rhizobium sp. PP-CC-3A-592]
MRTAVLVAIPTYRRPAELERLLSRIAQLDIAVPVTVLVADNDPEGRQGEEVVAALAARSYRFPLKAITVSAKGLANVRNTLFTHALSHHGFTHIAMIDDDEWPDAPWLGELLRVQRVTGADIVGAPVASIFEGAGGSWVRRARLFQPEARPEGPCPIIWASNNVLLTRDCIETAGPPWFDLAFNLTGGEDVELFTRLKAQGKRFAWAPGALIFESVPRERIQARWLLRRGLRIGSTDARIQLRHGTGRLHRVCTIGKAVLGLVASLSLLPLRALSGKRRADGLFSAARAAGKFYGFYGGTVHEYQ